MFMKTCAIYILFMILIKMVRIMLRITTMMMLIKVMMVMMTTRMMMTMLIMMMMIFFEFATVTQHGKRG